MDDQLALLLDFARRLAAARIPYMVTGSVALAAYATPRMTRDIDFVVEVGPEDVGRVVDLFRADCYVDRAAVQRAVEQRGMFNVIHDASVIKVDFIVRKDEPFRVTEFSRRRSVEIAGEAVQFAAPEDLILAKLCWSKESRSETQRRDVAELLAAAPLDRDYLHSWARELGVAAELETLERE